MVLDQILFLNKRRNMDFGKLHGDGRKKTAEYHKVIYF